MDRLNILYCTYRKWGTKIFYQLDFWLNEQYPGNNIHIEVATTSADVTKKTTAVEYDLIFFIGWSDIISPKLTGKGNCICLHPSNLPDYRGGSPLQHQIIDGVKDSAITFFIMDSGIDTGDILTQIPLSLEGDLIDILTRIQNDSYYVIACLIYDYQKSGKLIGTPQDTSNSKLRKRRVPEQSEITVEDLKNSTAADIHNKIRALQDPYPNAYITLNNGDRLYLLKSRLE